MELNEAYTALSAMQEAAQETTKELEKEKAAWELADSQRATAVGEVRQIQSSALRVVGKYQKALDENSELSQEKHKWMLMFFGALIVVGLYFYLKIQFPFLRTFLP